MDNVVELQVVTRLDIPAERVIRRANEANLSNVVVIGWDDDGDFYFASSYASGPEVLWLLEMAKKELMAAGDSVSESGGAA